MSENKFNRPMPTRSISNKTSSIRTNNADTLRREALEKRRKMLDKRRELSRAKPDFSSIPRVSEICTIEFQGGDGVTTVKAVIPPPKIEVTDTESFSGPPDGGWGWIVTLSSFFINVVIIGMHNSFAILYLDLVDEFEKSYATTAWVGSLAFGSILLFAPLSGFLANKYSCRGVALLGVLIASSGLLLSSYATSLTMLYFTYGFMYGFGTSLCYMQGTVMVTRYFTSKRALASGIALSGSTLGALVMAPFYEYLQSCLKWRRSLQAISGVTFLMVLCAASYKPLQKPRKVTTEERIKDSPARKFVKDYSLWKNKAFLVWAVAVALSKLGYLVPWVHMVQLSQDAGFSRRYGSKLIQYMGVAATISRLMIGKIVDLPQVNRQHVSQISSCAMGVTHIIQAYNFDTKFGLAAYSVLLGIMDGGVEILLPLMTLDLVGAENLSIAWGCILAVISLSSLGPPVAGKIRDTQKTYFWAFYFAGVPMIMAALVLFLIPWARRQPQPPATSILSINPSHLEVMEKPPSRPNYRRDSNPWFWKQKSNDNKNNRKQELSEPKEFLSPRTLLKPEPYHRPIPLPGT